VFSGQLRLIAIAPRHVCRARSSVVAINSAKGIVTVRGTGLGFFTVEGNAIDAEKESVRADSTIFVCTTSKANRTPCSRDSASPISVDEELGKEFAMASIRRRWTTLRIQAANEPPALTGILKSLNSRCV
jgi:hypothetical protein